VLYGISCSANRSSSRSSRTRSAPSLLSTPSTTGSASLLFPSVQKHNFRGSSMKHGSIVMAILLFFGLCSTTRASSVRQHWERSISVQINFASIMVADQNTALNFYTSVLGFRKTADIPMGEFRWRTVVSPDGIEGVELVLEPMSPPPSKAYQKALFDAGSVRDFRPAQRGKAKTKRSDNEFSADITLSTRTVWLCPLDCTPAYKGGHLG
jgi:catechol 2,3-dioxygenase-like lactoylglutathione lyase family enzyme